ncbi:hypothetical protein Drorol1_Dr00013178, partial [Drosera rotundifolia]
CGTRNLPLREGKGEGTTREGNRGLAARRTRKIFYATEKVKRRSGGGDGGKKRKSVVVGERLRGDMAQVGARQEPSNTTDQTMVSVLFSVANRWRSTARQIGKHRKQMEKHRKADGDLKKRVLKLEIYLQEASAQSRKLQRMVERKDQAIEELRDLLLTEQQT